MNMITSIEASLNYSFSGVAPANRQALVLIVSDSAAAVEQLERVCAFFDLGVEVVASEEELLTMLRDHRPMAVIADVDGVSRDGFDAMRVVAGYDHDLPI